MKRIDPNLASALAREPLRTGLRTYFESLRMQELERLASTATADDFKIVQGRAHMLEDLIKTLR